MASSDLKIRIMAKQNQILELLDLMINEGTVGNPGKDMLPVSYCVETITIQFRLLARILQERG